MCSFKNKLSLLTIFFLINLISAEYPKASSTVTNATKNLTTRSRGSRSGFDYNYNVWSQSNHGKMDFASIASIIALFGIGVLLLPFIASLFTSFFPHTYAYGRKKRSLDPFNSFKEDNFFKIIKAFENAMINFAKM